MKFTTKIARFVNGLKLIYRRRHTLSRGDIKAFCLITALMVGLMVLFLAFIHPSPLMEAAANPWPLYMEWQLGDGILSLSLSRGVVGAIAFILICAWACVLATLITIIGTCISSFYAYCLDNIQSKKVYATDHGGTLAKVLRGFQREPVEYLAVFDPQGDKIDETTNYDTTEVHFRNSTRTLMRKKKGCIMAHNHPSGWSGFSANDINCAISTCASKSIVVAGGVVYTLELTPACWELDREVIHQQHKRAAKQYTKLNKLDDMETEAAFHLGINAMLAEQLGMKLTVEKFEECQYFKTAPAAQPSKSPACAASNINQATPSGIHRS